MWRQSNKTKATFLISYVIHETLLYFDLIEYNFVKNKKILLWLREFSDLCGRISQIVQTPNYVD
jgi:hypothetical protein